MSCFNPQWEVLMYLNTFHPSMGRFKLYCIVLMGWPLLSNALRPFKIYCAPPTIISQLVLFLWQTVEIDPLGHVSVEALQNFVQKCDPMILPEFHIYIARVQQFHCR